MISSSTEAFSFIEDKLAVTGVLNQVSLFQHGQVLGNCGAGDRKLFCDLTGAESAGLQHIQDLPADGVGKRLQGTLDAHSVSLPFI